MKLIYKFFSFIFNTFFRFGRFIGVGFVTSVALIYASNGILSLFHGKADITVLVLLFSFFPLFLALFIELFFYFSRRSNKKTRISKEVDHLRIK